MELLNASLLKAAVSTRRSTKTKFNKISTTVLLPRTKVLVEGRCSGKHPKLYDE
jgi:hypothetical protein